MKDRYVIKKINTNLYVSFPGRENSYTNKLEYAQKFDCYEKALANCCGNEIVIDLNDIL